MKKNVFVVVAFGMVLLGGAVVGHAADWIKNNADIPNKNLEANYYDSKSVKVRKKTLTWTEKTVLTSFGATYYSKHLSKYPACQKSMSSKGEATHHQMDFEIKSGKYRIVAKRNYNKANELLCTDKNMGTELDKSWQEITYQSPMYFREYELVTKYKLGNVGVDLK
ncbi:MAG: hypothetical protein WC007_00945 [Pelobacteraceae bacterium]